MPHVDVETHRELEDRGIYESPHNPFYQRLGENVTIQTKQIPTSDGKCTNFGVRLDPDPEIANGKVYLSTPGFGDGTPSYEEEIEQRLADGWTVIIGDLRGQGTGDCETKGWIDVKNHDDWVESVEQVAAAFLKPGEEVHMGSQSTGVPAQFLAIEYIEQTLGNRVASILPVNGNYDLHQRDIVINRALPVLSSIGFREKLLAGERPYDEQVERLYGLEHGDPGFEALKEYLVKNQEFADNPENGMNRGPPTPSTLREFIDMQEDLLEEFQSGYVREWIMREDTTVTAIVNHTDPIVDGTAFEKYFIDDELKEHIEIVDMTGKGHAPNHYRADGYHEIMSISYAHAGETYERYAFNPEIAFETFYGDLRDKIESTLTELGYDEGSFSKNLYLYLEHKNMDMEHVARTFDPLHPEFDEETIFQQSDFFKFVLERGLIPDVIERDQILRERALEDQRNQNMDRDNNPVLVENFNAAGDTPKLS